MGIRGKNRKKVDLDKLNKELIAKNERNLNLWLEYQDAVNTLTDEALTKGYIQVEV